MSRRAAIVAVGLVLGASRAADCSDGTHVRGVRSIDDVVATVRTRAEVDGKRRVVVSLDEGLLDSEAWTARFKNGFPEGGVDLRLTLRAEPSRTPRATDFAELGTDDLVPASVEVSPREWAVRLARQATDQGLVVFVTSRPPRECWPSSQSARDRDDCFEPGFHEEEVGGIFARSGVPLWIVAPEAPFGLERPDHVLQFLPWASRPAVKWGNQMIGRWSRSDVIDLPLDGITASPHEVMNAPAREQGFPRFVSVLPCLLSWDVAEFDRWETDIPSGSGFWGYSRACALSGGRYVLFTKGGDEWFDRCEPANADVLRTVRIDVPAKHQQREIAKLDSVDAARAVVRRSLESLGSLFIASQGWNTLSPRNCLRKLQQSKHAPDPRLFLQNVLFDERLPCEWRQFASELVEPIAAHDLAVATITRILREDAAEGKSDPPVPLSVVADLELQRFWLKATAFHLEFVRVVAAAPEKFLYVFDESTNLHLGSQPSPAVRLSDCLVARDGRRVSPERELRSEVERAAMRDFGRESLLDLVPLLLGTNQVDQTNVLTSNPADPDYRAERDPDVVLRNLDPSLKTRALDCVAAARAIHDRWRDTPWDWMVYYADLEAFAWYAKGVIPGAPIRPRPKLDEEDEPEPTPRRPSPGSTGQPKPSTPGKEN